MEKEIKTTQSPRFMLSYPQRIVKILLLSTFVFAFAYACFLVGQYTFWFAVNYQNRNFATVFSFIMQLAIQALLVFSSVSTIKQRYKTALGLSIFSLIMYSASLFAPDTIIKGWLTEGITATDRFLYITGFCSTILLFLMTVAIITIAIIRIVKSKRHDDCQLNA